MFGFNTFIAINSQQKSWKATSNTIFVNMTVRDVSKMTGGRRSARAFPGVAPTSQEHLKSKTLGVIVVLHRFLF